VVDFLKRKCCPNFLKAGYTLKMLIVFDVFHLLDYFLTAVMGR